MRGLISVAAAALAVWLWLFLCEPGVTAEAQPLELVVAVVPEGFWRSECRTSEGDHSWTAFITPDTCILSGEGITVTWASETTAIIEIAMPALACTAFTFVDPPWPGEEELADQEDLEEGAGE